MRAAYDLTLCLLHLVPGAAFGTTDNDHALTEWLDARVMPTDAECAAAWPAVQAEIAAAAQAATTAKANETTIGQQVEAALASNATFLALASPTAAKNAAQVKALTRQMNGLIRLTRRKLDSA